MPAFQHAVDLGYTYLETDVHATSDGVLVAFHDADLARTCGRPGRIDSLRWSEVSQARVRETEPIPLFEDLVGSFPDARINIDCKANTGVSALTASLKRLNCLDRVCIGGFSDQRLRRLRHEFGARLCSRFRPRQTASLRAGARVPFGGQLAQVPPRVGRVPVVTPSLISRAHRRGYHVHVWTIDDPDEMTRLLDMEVDGIMTDRPQVLKDVLLARGEWH